MSVKKESNLQKRIQTLIRSRGGYVHKMHGDMISEPGIPDLIACYKGYYVAIEVKVDNNKPSKSQGIHCRKIWDAGGIACIVWNITDVVLLLNAIDELVITSYGKCNTLQKEINAIMFLSNMDDGRSW